MNFKTPHHPRHAGGSQGRIRVERQKKRRGFRDQILFSLKKGERMLMHLKKRGAFHIQEKEGKYGTRSGAHLSVGSASAALSELLHWSAPPPSPHPRPAPCLLCSCPLCLHLLGQTLGSCGCSAPCGLPISVRPSGCDLLRI